MLDDVVNKYNNTVHRIIKMKPIDVTDDYYAEYNENSIELLSNNFFFRISKYEKIFAEGSTPNWSE